VGTSGDLGVPPGPMTEHCRSSQAVQTSDTPQDPRGDGKFVFFADPDGNNWAVQEIRDYVGASI
jgi:hypothetical protein